MNRPYQILRKALRHFRVPLLLWAVVITLPEWIDFEFLRHAPDDATARERMLFLVYLLLGIESVIGFVLANAIAKDDSPRGTAAFWMTRPLPGSQLFLGKLTSVALLTFTWPILFKLPWHVALANAATSSPLTLPILINCAAAFALAGFFLGAFTTSFGQLVGWSMGLPIAAIVSTTIWTSWIGKPWPMFGGHTTASSFAIGSIVGAGALVALFILYRTRRVGTAVAVSGIFILVAILTPVFVFGSNGPN